MIVKFFDYEQITPEIVEMLKTAFPMSSAYVDAIFAKRGAKDWAESVAGLYTLYKAMSEAGLSVATAVIERAESGKPYFKNVPYYFNISHSCGRAVCVLDKGEVGVDIEFTKKKRNFELIAKNFFGQGEIERFYGAKNKAEEFYRIWTRKEALLKKSGSGIEFGVLRGIDTYSYEDAAFTEIKRGGYIVTVCSEKQQ